MLDIADGEGISDSVGLLCRLTIKREVVRELLFFGAEVFSCDKPFKEKTMNILKFPEGPSRRAHPGDQDSYRRASRATDRQRLR